MSTSRLRYHDYEFDFQDPQGVWRWTIRVDVSNTVPSYQARDIVSPWGLFRDSIPIPGEVVLSMAQSISGLASNFKPVIVVGPPTSLSFTVDEGRGYSEPQPALVSNSGIYGSLLGVTLSTSAAYIHVDPTSVGGLAKDASGEFQVSVDSTSLLEGTYAGTVTLQDPNALNTPQVLPVNITVRPRATIGASPTLLTFTVTRPLSGPFPQLPTQQFLLQNLGPVTSLLDYQIRRLSCTSPWLVSFSPASGQIPGGSQQAITVSVQPPVGTLAGVHEETLRISGYSNNSTLDITVRLVVT